MKKAALICVTRNNAEKLQVALNSIIQNTNPEHYDLFLIDNASSDLTLGIYQLRTLGDYITIVRSGKNLHWVGGINLGIEMTKGYQYVGFLNDDIEVCPNWLENFFDVLDCNPDVAAVGPLTSNSRDWQGYDNVRSRLDLPECYGIDRNDVRGMYEQTKNNASGAKIPGMLAFFCILLRRSVIDEIGNLDSDFTELYFGDDDYCNRIKYAGYQLAISTRNYVAHYSGTSSLSLDEINLRQKASYDLLSNKQNKRISQRTIRTTANPHLATYLNMRERWESCLNLMPFFNCCSGQFSSKQPFPSLNNYVFNPGKDLAICSLYTPEIVTYAAESEKSLLSYCLKHDYTAYIYRSGIYGGIHPAWHKARLLLNHLADHRAMVWMDADTLILRQSERVFEQIHDQPKPLHVSRDLIGGKTVFNSGVILFKNDAWVFNLLKDWDAFAQEKRPPNLWDYGSDQQVLCDLILERDPAGEFHEAHEMSVFNTDPRFMDENTFLLHFMAYPAGYKIPWMHYWNSSNLDFREQDFLDRIHTM